MDFTEDHSLILIAAYHSRCCLIGATFLNMVELPEVSRYVPIVTGLV